jgi:hypothetical protein
MKAGAVMKGPIDYIIVGFEGNKFDGSILKAIGDAIDKDIIGLVALVFVQKDAQGKVTTMDAADYGDTTLTEFTAKYKSDSSLVTRDDINEMAELVKPDTAIGMLVIEHLWAIPLKEALMNANGSLVAEGRIHPAAAAELNKVGG